MRETEHEKPLATFFYGSRACGVTTQSVGVVKRPKPPYFSGNPNGRSACAISTPSGRCEDGVARNPRMSKRSLVVVVDDDESVRESLPDLLGEFGFAAKAFGSAEEFLASDCVREAKCLILDIAMPRMSGPDLQHELNRRGMKTPIVFITAQADETARQRLLRQDAVDCLFKPFSDTALRDAVDVALRRK
jgi:CheY-like chemotaxis protein